MGSIYCYIRVSSKDQHEDRQLITMNDYGVPKRNFYIDKQSGKDFDRPKYKKLVRKLKKDDLLYIKSIDRLGRNYEEILEQWKNGTVSGKKAATLLGMSPSTFLYKAKRMSQNDLSPQL